MWLYAMSVVGLCLGLVPNCVVLVLCNESGCPYHMQGRDTRDLEIKLRMLVNLTLNISSNIQLRLILFSLFMCFAQRPLIYIYIYSFLNIDHIATCMCNSLECWLKLPLPLLR